MAPAQKVLARRNQPLEVKLNFQLKSGYHVNSNAPNDDYLIPLRLTWDAKPMEVAEVVFPKPVLEKASFSEKPVSVFTGDFSVVTKFKVPANATTGLAILAGKLRYQACNDRMCLPPKTLDVRVPMETR